MPAPVPAFPCALPCALAEARPDSSEEEIRMINEKLDFYVMEASDEEFDTEEVRKLVKRLDELDPIPLPWKSDEEALKDFWEYCEERQREERRIAEMKIKG